MRSFLLLLFVAFAVACGGPTVARRPPIRASEIPLRESSSTAKPGGSIAVTRALPAAEPVPPPLPLPPPPWQVWDEGLVFNDHIGAGDRLARNGDLKGAIAEYLQAEQTSSSPADKTQAVVRRVGTSLRLGESSYVLQESADFLKRSGKQIGDTHPELALIVAFAYLKENKPEQTFAWLKLARTRGEELPRVNEVSGIYLGKIAQSLTNEELEMAATKWANDELMKKVISDEKERRSHGGERVPLMLAQYFGGGEVADDTAITFQPTFTGGPLVIGVLLPLSGQYEEHALRIRHGIELALQSQAEGSRPTIFFADTRGDPIAATSEFERLANDNHITAVIGPLLSRDAEAVGPLAQKRHIPMITFTKRPNITQSGDTVFRLGATSRDQARELIDYASKELHVSQIAVVTSGGESETELIDAVRSAAGKLGVTVATEQKYVSDDAQSIQNTVTALVNVPVGAIFIPDPLERAAKVIAGLKQSSLKDTVLLGPAVWDDLASLRGYSQSLQGAIYVTPFFLKSNLPNVVSFVKEYQQQYGEEPDVLSAQAYDATKMLLERASAGSDVAKALRSGGAYEGVTGKLTVEQDGEISRRMAVVKVTNGEPEEVMSSGVSRGIRFDG